MKKYVSFIALSLWLGATCFGQVEGFWQATKVTVGDKVMTPVAKWFRINTDGTQQGGNGWLQNSEGIWTYDKNTSIFIPTNNNDIKDEFGGFLVSFEENYMIWEREEEGMNVKVNLVPITELPKGPADELNGLWLLTKVEKENYDVTTEHNPNGNRYIHLRWSRDFVDDNDTEGRISGIWHMNAHRPLLTLITNDAGVYVEKQYQIEFEDDRLILMGNSDNVKGLKMEYVQIDLFP